MRASRPLAAALARLVSWDAPFLPQVTSVSAAGGDLAIGFADAGVPLRVALAWPRGRRLAVATQLVAAVEFFFERGWFVGRAALRGARIVKEEGGDRVRLGELPRLRLGDARLGRRLRSHPALRGDPRPAVLAPILRSLVAEKWPALEAVIGRDSPWMLGEGLIGILTGDGRNAGSLRHPGGGGRALWARQFTAPRSGVVLVEDEAAEGRVEAARVVRPDEPEERGAAPSGGDPDGA